MTRFAIQVNNTNPQPCEVEFSRRFGNNVAIKIHNDKNLIVLWGTRSEMTETFKTIMGQMNMTVADMTYRWPSKSEMLEYFRQNVDLFGYDLVNEVESILADQDTDLSRALMAIQEGRIAWPDGTPVALESLFEAGQPSRGAQSRIAEALGIPNAGQGNRERIGLVLSKIHQKMNSTILSEAQDRAWVA